MKALLKELNLDESEVEKLETIPYYELSNAYNKVEAEVAAKGCYIGQGPMENGWFRGNPIKCGFTDTLKRFLCWQEPTSVSLILDRLCRENMR